MLYYLRKNTFATFCCQKKKIKRGEMEPGHDTGWIRTYVSHMSTTQHAFLIDKY